jgi:hypothetical protein
MAQPNDYDPDPENCGPCADGDACPFHEGVNAGAALLDHLWHTVIAAVLCPHDAEVIGRCFAQVADAQEFYGSEITAWPGFTDAIASARAELRP